MRGRFKSRAGKGEHRHAQTFAGTLMNFKTSAREAKLNGLSASLTELDRCVRPRTIGRNAI